MSDWGCVDAGCRRRPRPSQQPVTGRASGVTPDDESRSLPTGALWTMGARAETAARIGSRPHLASGATRSPRGCRGHLHRRLVRWAGAPHRCAVGLLPHPNRRQDRRDDRLRRGVLDVLPLRQARRRQYGVSTENHHESAGIGGQEDISSTSPPTGGRSRPSPEPLEPRRPVAHPGRHDHRLDSSFSATFVPESGIHYGDLRARSVSGSAVGPPSAPPVLGARAGGGTRGIAAPCRSPLLVGASSVALADRPWCHVLVVPCRPAPAPSPISPSSGRRIATTSGARVRRRKVLSSRNEFGCGSPSTPRWPRLRGRRDLLRPADLLATGGTSRTTPPRSRPTCSSDRSSAVRARGGSAGLRGPTTPRRLPWC